MWFHKKEKPSTKQEFTREYRDELALPGESVSTTKYFIPTDKIEGLYQLIDQYNKIPRGEDYAAKYKLWEFIAKIFPDVEEGVWGINTHQLLRPFVYKNENKLF